MNVGQKVVCNGFEGIVKTICTGQLVGMVEVKLPGGVVCVDATTVVPVRQYHIVAINEKSGAKVYMTASPVTHDEACTMLKKISKHPARRVQLEQV